MHVFSFKKCPECIPYILVYVQVRAIAMRGMYEFHRHSFTTVSEPGIDYSTCSTTFTHVHTWLTLDGPNKFKGRFNAWICNCDSVIKPEPSIVRDKLRSEMLASIIYNCYKDVCMT